MPRPTLIETAQEIIGQVRRSLNEMHANRRAARIAIGFVSPAGGFYTRVLYGRDFAIEDLGNVPWVVVGGVYVMPLSECLIACAGDNGRTIVSHDTAKLLGFPHNPDGMGEAASDDPKYRDYAAWPHVTMCDLARDNNSN